MRSWKKNCLPRRSVRRLKNPVAQLNCRILPHVAARKLQHTLICIVAFLRPHACPRLHFFFSQVSKHDLRDCIATISEVTLSAHQTASSRDMRDKHDSAPLLACCGRKLLVHSLLSLRSPEKTTERSCGWLWLPRGHR